jgi:hypothetical protein
MAERKSLAATHIEGNATVLKRCCLKVGRDSICGAPFCAPQHAACMQRAAPAIWSVSSSSTRMTSTSLVSHRRIWAELQ